MNREPKPTFDPTYIRDISEKVYREVLGSDDTARMIEKDKDNGEASQPAPNYIMAE